MAADPPTRQLPLELAVKMRAIFEKHATETKPCQHCGGIHNRTCPRVKSFSFHVNGSLSGAEFWPEGKWSDDNVIWPEDCDTIEPDQLAIEAADTEGR